MRFGSNHLGLGGLIEGVQRERAHELATRLGKLSDELARFSKMASDDDLLTSKEVAPLVGVTHHKTVEVWARPRGKKGGRGLPCVRLGRNLRFRRGDVRAWWRAQQES